MTKCYFITGTDTKVGKTVISVALLQIAQKYGYITAGYKPVATGSRILSNRLYNDDAIFLQKNSSLKLEYCDVNPYNFLKPTSPHITSFEEYRPINFTVLSTGLHMLKNKANWVLIEGAGGWFTPLSEDQTFADWVILERLPVILVVGIKLGCINHAILTAKAIISAKLCLIGWVANNVVAPDNWHSKYIITLQNLISAPLLGIIPWFEKDIDYKNIGNYLDFTKLCHAPSIIKLSKIN